MHWSLGRSAAGLFCAVAIGSILFFNNKISQLEKDLAAVNVSGQIAEASVLYNDRVDNKIGKMEEKFENKLHELEERTNKTINASNSNH